MPPLGGPGRACSAGLAVRWQPLEGGGVRLCAMAALLMQRSCGTRLLGTFLTVVAAAALQVGAPASCSAPLVGIDFDGADVQPVQRRSAANASTCCAICLATPGCKFFTFFVDVKQCFPKTSASGWRTGAANHPISGCIGACPPSPPPPGPLPKGGGACKNASDCQLAGVCTNGECVCDPQWQGAFCQQLALVGDGSLAYGDPDGAVATITSWGGGPPVFDAATQRWLLFVTEIAGHCGLSSWGSQSTVVVSTAATPAGPFLREAVAVPHQAHNPYYAFDPSSKMHLIFHIGPGDGKGTPRQCHNGTTPPSPSPTMWPPSSASGDQLPVASLSQWVGTSRSGTGCPCACTGCGSWLHAASDLSGPFEQVKVEFPGDFEMDNPAPYVFPNGTVIVLSRRINNCASGDPRAPRCANGTALTEIWLMRAPSFRGPYTLVQLVTGVTNEEDPTLFRDSRGNFHALFHGPVSCAVTPHKKASNGFMLCSLEKGTRGCLLN